MEFGYNKRRKPMKNSTFLELNLLDEEHGLYGRCKTSNTQRYYYFSMCDFEKIKEYCWSEHINKGTGYRSLRAKVNKKVITMHKLLGFNNPDHINRNALDNRRENLNGNTTNREQCLNQGLRKDNKYGCKGIEWRKQRGKWQARISVGGKQKYLGLFESKEDAIISRLKAELFYYGDKEYLWQKELMKKYKLIGGEKIEKAVQL